MRPPSCREVTGVVLAGGAGRRMGGADKGLQTLAGIALAERALQRLRPQVVGVLISANRNREAYAAYGAPVVADALPGFQGPLAGLLAGLENANTAYVAAVPCDCPDFPLDLVERLCAAAADGAPAAYARAGERDQPVFCLVRRDLAGRLRQYLANGDRCARGWLTSVGAAVADFGANPAPFENLNSAEELRQRNERSRGSRPSARR